eukprot:EC718475.1.p1 GENE.EC718475.1~~EC718475.1.p1  ORF type:complete len:119 (+),score=23.72 EC718475.1:28-357(+)
MTVIEITDAQGWDKEMAAAGDKYVIVDFKAVWCGPCKMIAPTYHKMSEANPSMVFLSVDVDNVPSVARDQQIEAMPTFRVYKHGKQVDSLVGAGPAALTELVKKYSGSS